MYQGPSNATMYYLIIIRPLHISTIYGDHQKTKAALQRKLYAYMITHAVVKGFVI
jgi:hypothetical protein